MNEIELKKLKLIDDQLEVLLDKTSQLILAVADLKQLFDKLEQKATETID